METAKAKEWMGNKWLVVFAVLSFIVAMLMADWVGAASKMNAFFSKPLATLATVNTLAMGAVSGLVLHWAIWRAPRVDPLPEPGTVHWYEEQRLRLGCVALGVLTFIFGGGVGALSS